MKKFFCLFFFVFINCDLTYSEPFFPNRYNYYNPRYQNHPPVSYHHGNNYDYINDSPYSRFIFNDNNLIHQTDQFSERVRSIVASKLIDLAQKLQRAANLLMDDSLINPRPDRDPINNFENNRPEDNPQIKNFQNLKPNFMNESKLIVPNKVENSEKDGSSKNIENVMNNTPNNPKNNNQTSLGFEFMEDKKKEDEKVAVQRKKRETYYESDKSLKKRQIKALSVDVKEGYNNVINLLNDYLNKSPFNNRRTEKRDNERAEQLLENIKEAKKIFTNIEEYVAQQFYDNYLNQRNQTNLLSYFDSVVNVEKNRINMALNEFGSKYATELKTNQNLKPDYQNDGTINFRDPFIKKFTRRNQNERSFIDTDDVYENKDEKPKITIKRIYIGPKVISRPARRQPSINEGPIRPPYEINISAKEPVESEREYEMIEP